VVGLSEGHAANEVSTLPVCDEFAATCTATLLYAFFAKEVTVPRRATQEFTGTGLLETLGD
jgi:hypothetical protein